MDQNIVTLVGRLAADPELKQYPKPDGTVGHRCFIRLAICRLMDRGEKDRTKQRTNFIPIVCWGDQATRHAQFLAKGTEVCVTGELVVDSKQLPDGTWQNFFNVQARDIQYGRPSMKNATAQQLNTQVAGIQARLTELAAAPALAAQPQPAAIPAAVAAPAPLQAAGATLDASAMPVIPSLDLDLGAPVEHPFQPLAP